MFLVVCLESITHNTHKKDFLRIISRAKLGIYFVLRVGCIEIMRSKEDDEEKHLTDTHINFPGGCLVYICGSSSVSWNFPPVRAVVTEVRE